MPVGEECACLLLMIPSPIFSLPLSPLFLSSSLSFLFPFFLALDNLSTFLLALPFFSLPTSPPPFFQTGSCSAS